MGKNIFKIFAGFMMIVTVLAGYIPQPQYLIELTCISNMLGGLLLLIDGILNISQKKRLPAFLYLNISLCLSTVFFVCMGSLSGVYKFNFSGAFFFLHVINPILFVACYMFFCNEAKKKIKYVLMAPILMLLYLLFDYIQCQFTGKFVYGFVSPEETTLPYALMIGIVIYILMCLLACVLLGINKHMHKNKNKAAGQVFIYPAALSVGILLQDAV